MCKWNFLYFSLGPLLHILSLNVTTKSLTISFTFCTIYLNTWIRSLFMVCHILKAEEMHKKSWCNNFIYFIAYTCCQNDQTFWQTLSVHNTYWWTPSTSQSFPTSLGAMFCRVLGQISINLQRSDQPICKTKMQLF